MSLRLVGLAFAGLMAGAILAYTISQQSGLPNGAVVTGTPTVGGPFTLTDQTGKRVTEKDFQGHYTLVFFGFTHCPDICPSGLQVMSAALDKLGPRADDITPVFITLDADRDTPDALKQYLASFYPRLVGLTGSAEELAAVAKAYRVYYQKVADAKSPENYTYDHSAIFYLMGKDGKLVAPIPHTTDVDEFVTRLNTALK